MLNSLQHKLTLKVYCFITDVESFLLSLALHQKLCRNSVSVSSNETSKVFSSSWWGKSTAWLHLDVSTYHCESLRLDTLWVPALEVKEELSFPLGGRRGRLFTPVDFKAWFTVRVSVRLSGCEGSDWWREASSFFLHAARVALLHGLNVFDW